MCTNQCQLSVLYPISLPSYTKKKVYLQVITCAELKESLDLSIKKLQPHKGLHLFLEHTFLEKS